MTVTPLRYTRTQINAAGKTLISRSAREEDAENAIAIVDNFRAAHSFPLDTFQHRLRKVAKQIDKRAVVAQRLKRLSSIIFKLERFKTMKLCEMQDIGGCRAIVKSVRDVESLANDFKWNEPLRLDRTG